ncbi:MAG: hypothetical protein ACTHZ9_10215 [Leucobacter sp.]
MPHTEQPSVLITSHCVLNQNAVVEPLARSTGVMHDAVNWAKEQGYGIYQLPCPEFAFLGPKRPPMSTEQYNTPGFHASNNQLLDMVVADLRRFHRSGARLIGSLHVEGSPSCDPDTGNWVSDLLAALEQADIPLTMIWQLPETETGSFDARSTRTRFGDPKQRAGTPGGLRLTRTIAGATLPVRSAGADE